MARFLAALCSSLFFFGLTLAATHNLVVAILVAIITLIILFFTLSTLEIAHLSDETASKFHKTH